MKRRLARTLQLLVPALAVGLLFGAGGWQLQRQRNADDAQRRLDDLSARLERRLQERLRSYEHGLRGLRGLVQGLGIERFDLAQFERYMGSRDLPREFPGLRGTGLIRRVDPAQERDFIAATQLAGQPAFRVRQLHPHDEERFVIQYVAPLADNRAALGLDIGSEPTRRRAALDAARSGEARLTAPIGIVQAPGQASALLLLPIYAEGRVPRESAQRLAACIGWSYAPLVVPEVLQSLDLGDPLLRLKLFDAAQSEPVFVSGMGGEMAAGSARDIAVFGRQWQLRVEAPADYPQALGLPEPSSIGLATGLFAALAALLLMQAREARARSQALQAERGQRAALVEASSDAHVLLDAEGRVLDWNPGAERLLGRPAAQALGRPAAALLCSGDGELAALLAELAQQGRLPPQDRVCRHPDGRVIDLSLVAAALREPDGRLRGYALTLRDIGAAKALERQMQQLNTRLELQVAERTALLDRVGELARVGGWQLLFDGQQLSWTAETYRLHGVPADYRPTLREALDFYAPAGRAQISAAVERAARDGMPWDLELPFRPRDGRQLWVRAVGVPMWRDGQIVGMQGALQDITARRDAERERQRNAELLRLVLDSASEVSIIATDPRLQIQVFNRGAERLLGYRAEELVGRDTPMRIHVPAEVEQRERELAAQFGRALGPGEVFTLHERLGQVQPWTYRRKDGSLVPVLLTVTAMSGDDGELLGYLGIAQDASLQQQRERALQLAREKAEQASAAKGQFLANMSHEIRTPMNAVLGLAYLLAQTPLDAEQARFVARIRSASQGLLGLLNDILDLSKIEAGELILEQRGFAPRALLAQLQELFSAQAEGKGLSLRLDLPAELPAALRGDATRLRQVLTNLVANAIKFTASGGVRLGLQAQALGGGDWRLRFEVEDSGIGIAAEAQQAIFHPFAQADASTTRRYGGTGLGLSIARELVDAMGGRLELRSRPGLGSCFWFELQLAETALPAGEQEAATQRLDGVRVLVADDSEINVEVASRILAQQGAEVCSAADGEAAIALLQTRPVDIVLMDLQMPVLDGVAATRRLREAGFASPIVALTAGALASERQRALDAGMNAFLGKPFLPQELIALVRRLVPVRAPAVAAVASDVAPAWPELPGIDRAGAAARLGGDFALFGRLLRQLLRDAPASEAALRDAAALHKLRGAAGNLGAQRLQRLASEAEAVAGQGDGVALETLLPGLRAALDELRAAVERLPDAVQPAPAAGGDLQRLREQLRGNDLAALAHAEAMAGRLREQLGDAGWAQFQQLLAGLRFSEAEALLG